jgi:hypothetical protein
MHFLRPLLGFTRSDHPKKFWYHGRTKVKNITVEETHGY